jgi:F-type H+-transporting ATPase subunit alpha
VTELLKQKQYAPMSVAQQGLVLFAAERGYLEDVELAKIGSFEAALLAYVDRDHAPLMQEINQSGGYNDEIEGKLKASSIPSKQPSPGNVWRLVLGQAARH